MTGGKLATCAPQPAASCCLKPCSNWWNIELSSCEGLFHFTIALQNHKRLYRRIGSAKVTNAEESTCLGDARWVRLHESA